MLDEQFGLYILLQERNNSVVHMSYNSIWWGRALPSSEILKNHGKTQTLSPNCNKKLNQLTRVV